jgi:DNA-3-methyladenine glycosylase II
VDTNIRRFEGDGRMQVGSGTDDEREPGSLIGGVAGDGPVVDMAMRDNPAWALGTDAALRCAVRSGASIRMLTCQPGAFTRIERVHGDLGERIDTPAGPLMLFPTAEVLLATTPEHLRQLGLGFKTDTLRTAARALLEHPDWAALDPRTLSEALQRVRGIGRWGAEATIADVTNDFSGYTVGDLAVRTSATTIAPERSWPDGEREFEAYWRELAGDEVSSWTRLALARGARHA